tara:strand:- start:440 stop:1057 length:618 start_codon:yes stop_codon:yes gene_type:complete
MKSPKPVIDMRIESLLDTIESTNVHEVVDRALKDSRAALDRLHELNRSYDREQRRNDVLRAKVKFLEERLNEREPDLDVDMEFKRSLQNFEENVKQLGHTDYDMFTYLGGKWVHIIVQSHVAKYNYPSSALVHLEKAFDEVRWDLQDLANETYGGKFKFFGEATDTAVTEAAHQEFLAGIKLRIDAGEIKLPTQEELDQSLNGGK